MFGVLGSTLGNNFYMGTQNGSNLEIFYSHLQFKDMAPNRVSHMLYREAMHLQCFTPTRTYINVTTFTGSAQNCNVGGLLTLYGSTMHVTTL